MVGRMEKAEREIIMKRKRLVSIEMFLSILIVIGIFFLIFNVYFICTFYLLNSIPNYFLYKHFFKDNIFFILNSI